MTNPALGTKQLCESCGARFFDMNKIPATCPKCATVVGEKMPLPVEDETPDDDDDIEDILDMDEDVEGDDENDEGLMEDASDITGDDDVSAVIGTMDDDGSDKG